MRYLHPAMLVVVLSAAGSGCVLDGPQEKIAGSKNLVTQEIKVADFTGLDVSTAFHVDVTRGDGFQVSVTTDDNVFPFVKVVKDGSTLKIFLDTGNRSISATQLKAAVTMPSLEAVTCSGAVHGTIRGFQTPKDIRVSLNGASTLDGDIQAGKAVIEVAGASNVNLKGSARSATLTVSGASTATLSEFICEECSANVSGASHAKVHARAKLDYVVSGASNLKYFGTPQVGKSDVTGASSAGRQ